MSQEFATYAALFGSFATAIATVALWYVTGVLAKETKRMADASAQPQVVAMIVPNMWSTRHFDIAVENTGNATAFDIEVAFDPPLTNGEARPERSAIPFQRVSVLKPGQSLTSYLSDVGDYLDRNFRVIVSWKLTPLAKDREELTYWLNMTEYRDVSYLGSRDPNVQVAEQIKKLREDWQWIASGSKKIQADVFSSMDRELERKMRNDWFKEQQEQNEIHDEPS